MNESEIEENVKRYWGNIPKIEDSLEAEIKYLEGLKVAVRGNTVRKYDDEIIGKYMSFYHHEEIRETPKFMDFIYSTRLYEDISPRTSSQYKESLEILIKYWNDKNDLSILDLGCGVGKITIGLALLLDNIKYIYAVDRSIPAIDVFKENKAKLNYTNYRTTQDKVKILNKDYTSLEFLKKAKQHIKNRLNTVLMLFPQYNEMEILKLMKTYKAEGIISVNSELIISTAQKLGNLTAEQISGSFQLEIQEYVSNQGYSYDMIDYKAVNKSVLMVGRIM
ncbi:TPA: methyltransferase domain-containing protein [Candidatus Woesearchaeota archaeon]|nr:methyltransferase domain-containing protein [Candidatus Woesearchaeota archaeon]